MVSIKICTILTFLTIFIAFDNTYARTCTQIINDYFVDNANYGTGIDYIKNIFVHHEITEFEHIEAKGYVNYLFTLIAETDNILLPDVFCNTQYLEINNCLYQLTVGLFMGKSKQDIVEYSFKYISIDPEYQGTFYMRDYVIHVMENCINFIIVTEVDHSPSHYCNTIHGCRQRIENQFGNASNNWTGFQFAQDIIENHIIGEFMDYIIVAYANFLLTKINPGEYFITPLQYCENYYLEDFAEREACKSEIYNYGGITGTDPNAIIEHIYSDISIETVNNRFVSEYVIYVKDNITLTSGPGFHNGPTPIQFCIGFISQTI